MEKVKNQKSKRSLGIRNAVYFISFPITFIGFILPIYAVGNGASAVELGMLYSIFTFFSLILKPLVGKIIDTKGRKVGFIIGLIGYAAVNGLLLMGRGYYYIFGAKILLSVAASFLWISLNAMIYDSSDEEERRLKFASLDQVWNSGANIGAFIGFAVLFNMKGEQKFTYVFGGYLLISLFAIYKGIRETKESLGLRKLTQEDSQEIKVSKTNYMKFIFVTMLFSTLASILAPVFLLYLRDHLTGSIMNLSYIFIPGAILAGILPRKLAILTQKYSLRTLIVFGIILDAAFTCMVPFAKGFIAVVVVITITDIMGMVYGPAKKSMVSKYIGDREVGKAYGIYSLAAGLGGIIGPLLGAVLYEKLQGGSVFYIQAVGLILCAIMYNFIIKENESESLVEARA